MFVLFWNNINNCLYCISYVSSIISWKKQKIEQQRMWYLPTSWRLHHPTSHCLPIVPISSPSTFDIHVVLSHSAVAIHRCPLAVIDSLYWCKLPLSLLSIFRVLYPTCNMQIFFWSLHFSPFSNNKTHQIPPLSTQHDKILWEQSYLFSFSVRKENAPHGD